MSIQVCVSTWTRQDKLQSKMSGCCQGRIYLKTWLLRSTVSKILSQYYNSNLFNLLLAANTAPVNAPDEMEFHGSSFCRMCTRAQSNVENKPPQTAKLPTNKYLHT